MNNFIAFTQGLLNVIQQNQALQSYKFNLYCIDLQNVSINPNGRRALKSQFGPVKDERGIYIFFDKRNLQTLYVGAAGLAGGPSAAFYTTPIRQPGGGITGGSGRVPQHLSGNRTTSRIITDLACFERSLINYLKPIVQ